MSADPGPDFGTIDDYVTRLFAPPDPALEAALLEARAEGLPEIEVSAIEGKLLGLLIAITGARRVLEIGTLGGYSAIWMARALPPDGTLLSLEIDPAHAAVAVRSIQRAGLADRVEVRVGPALELLAALPTPSRSAATDVPGRYHAAAARLLASARGVDAGRGAMPAPDPATGPGPRAEPFDVVFIDADKVSYPAYLGEALRLVRPGGLILADNVIRNGRVVDPTRDEDRAVALFNELVGSDPRLDAVVVPMLRGAVDGLAIVRVLPA